MAIARVRELLVPIRVSRSSSGELTVARIADVVDEVSGVVLDFYPFGFSKDEADLWFSGAATSSSKNAQWVLEWASANWINSLPAGCATKTSQVSVRPDGADYIVELLIINALLPDGPRLAVSGATPFEREALVSDQYLETKVNGFPGENDGSSYNRILATEPGEFTLEQTDVNVGPDGFFRASLNGDTWAYEWNGTGWGVLAASQAFAMWLSFKHPNDSEWVQGDITWSDAPSVGFRTRRVVRTSNSAILGSNDRGELVPGTRGGYDIVLDLGRAGEKMLVAVGVTPNATRTTGNVGYTALRATAAGYVPEGNVVDGFRPIHGPNLVHVAAENVANSFFFDLGANAIRPDVSSPDVGKLNNNSRALAAKLAKARDEAAYNARKKTMFRKLLKLFLFVMIIVIAFNFPAILSWATTFISSALGITLPTIAAASIPWWVGGAVALGLSYLIAPDATTELVGDVGKAVGSVAQVAANTAGDVASSLLSRAAPLLAIGAVAWFLISGKKKDDNEVRIVQEPANA